MGLSKFQIWLMKKLYRIPYSGTADSEPEPLDDEESEEEIKWITDPSQAEVLFNYFGILILPPNSSDPLSMAKERLAGFSERGIHLCDYQLRAVGGGFSRFKELTILPPIYLVVDEALNTTDWEHVRPDRIPWIHENPKHEEGVSDDAYWEIFNAFLDENIQIWSEDLRDIARRKPDHFVVLLDCEDPAGGGIYFESMIELMP